MKKLLILLTILILAGCGGEEIPLEDPAFRECVRDYMREMDKGSYKKDIYYLPCSNRDIRSLAGIENIENLRWPRFNNTPIEDYSGIELTSITELHISDMQVVPDLAAIAKIKTLEELYADNSEITSEDLDGLKAGELPNLKKLQLESNNIVSVEGVSHLGSLEKLYMENNYISDVSVLISLKNLEYLDIAENCFLDNAQNTYELLSEFQNDFSFSMRDDKTEQECREAWEKYGE